MLHRKGEDSFPKLLFQIHPFEGFQLYVKHHKPFNYVCQSHQLLQLGTTILQHHIHLYIHT